MMLMKYLMAMMFDATNKNSTPMKTVMGILMASWMSATNLNYQSGSSWASIMLIMAFNGGLMILYVFAIAMTIQEKMESKIGLKVNVMLFMMITLMLNTMHSKKQNEMFNSMYQFNSKMIIFMTIILIIMLIPMMKMTISPFKTLKTSN